MLVDEKSLERPLVWSDVWVDVEVSPSKRSQSSTKSSSSMSILGPASSELHSRNSGVPLVLGLEGVRYLYSHGQCSKSRGDFEKANLVPSLKLRSGCDNFGSSIAVEPFTFLWRRGRRGLVNFL